MSSNTVQSVIRSSIHPSIRPSIMRRIYNEGLSSKNNNAGFLPTTLNGDQAHYSATAGNKNNKRSWADNVELWIIVFLCLLCLASRAQLSGKRNTLHELKKKRGSYLQEEFPHPLHDRRSGGGGGLSSLEARVDTTMHQL